jgi:subfamily B ATP-binding cassette protein MsbA
LDKALKDLKNDGRRTFGVRTRGTLARFVGDWLRPRWRQVALVLAFTAGLAATTGGYPLVIKHSFDALMRPDSPGLAWVLAAISAITALRGTFLYLQQVTGARFVLRLLTDIQKTAFAHLINADYARLTRETTGHLVSRLTNDLAFIQQSVQTSLITFVKDSLSLVAVLVVMFYLDWAMALITVAIGPIAVLPVRKIGLRLRDVARRTQAELGGMTSRLTEKLAAARLIKAYGLERYATEHLNQVFEQVFRLRVKAVRTRARVGPLLEALAGLALAGVIAFAYWRIAGGASTVGDFLGFVTSMLLAAQSIKSLGNVSASALEGLAAAERVYELLDEQPTVVERPGARALEIKSGSIAFENVCFTYGDHPDSGYALKNFSLTVPGCKTVAFVGRSGAGKSTLINLVARLFDVESGRILIDGQDVRDVTLASLRGELAIVSQEVTLFDDTIYANIALGRLGARREEVVAAAQAAAAHECIRAQPEGYETTVGDGGLRLSVGQRQRLTLARAILKNAPILLLDEATSALDNESERLVQEALARFTRNRTTLVIAHRLSTIQRADLICVMDGGRIMETGPHAELLARDGAYGRLYRSQFRDDEESAVPPPPAAA